jgi:hypothetical protein
MKIIFLLSLQLLLANEDHIPVKLAAAAGT